MRQPIADWRPVGGIEVGGLLLCECALYAVWRMPGFTERSRSDD